MDILNKAKEIAEAAADKAKELGGEALDATKNVAGTVAEKTGDAVDAVKHNETVENATEAAGGFFQKAKDAVVHAAENVTHKDLDGDGNVG